MKQDDPFLPFIIGIFMGVFIIIFITSMWPEISKPYNEGVKATEKIAFEKGFMIKEIDKDDKVIYKWKD